MTLAPTYKLLVSIYYTKPFNIKRSITMYLIYIVLLVVNMKV